MNFISKKINIFAITCCIIIAMMFNLANAATTLIDFNDGQNNNSTGGHFGPLIHDRTDGPDYQILGITSEETAHNTTYSLKDMVVECDPTGVEGCHTGNMYLIYYSSTTSKALIPQAYGMNRMSFMIKIPDGYPLASTYQLHVGTYSKDPVVNDQGSMGIHYYHWANFPGSPYWTKIICNTHPQHQVGHSGEDPGDNPTNTAGWNYYDGLNRFYIDMVRESSIPLPWTGYVDEFIFYNASEPEDDVNISTISCSYLGGGHFYLGWQGDQAYTATKHQYEIRWSLSPITNNNYNNATIVPGSPFGGAANPTNFIGANFMIEAHDNTVYYFAIKDIDGGVPYVSKIDYIVGNATPEASKPIPTITNITIDN